MAGHINRISATKPQGQNPWIYSMIYNASYMVPDGSDYSIQFAVKADNSNDWQLVLCPNNLPNYAAATVKNNTIVSVKQNEPVLA